MSLEFIQIQGKESELYPTAIKIRTDVFQIEQEILAKYESDPQDTNAYHVLMKLGDKYIGVCRWHHHPENHVSLGRFAIQKEYRGQGFGRVIVEHALDKIQKDTTLPRIIKLSAHKEVVEFYKKFGFQEIGDVWNIDNYELIWMKKQISE